MKKALAITVLTGALAGCGGGAATNAAITPQAHDHASTAAPAAAPHGGLFVVRPCAMLVPDSQVILELVSTTPVKHPNDYTTPIMGVCSDMEAKLTRATGMYIASDRHRELPSWPVSCIVHDPNAPGVGVVVRGTELAPKMCTELVKIGFAQGRP
jgi:hypothetical protein